MSTTTFGLSYLDEQQRFRRSPSNPIVKPRQVIADFKVGVPTTNPVAIKQVVSSPVRSSDFIRHTVIPEPVVQAQPAETQTVFAEQFVEEANSKRRTIFKILPIAVAGLALISGLAILGLSLHQNHKAAAQVAAIAKKSVDAGTADAPPSEEPVTPAAIGKYTVAPDMPRLITIKKINVTARILSMGVLASGALATPRNTNDVGWYNGSSKPGTGGAALLVGHVSGATNVGIFYNLKNLVAGDIVTIERGDGTKFNYKVVQKEQVLADKVDNAKLLLPITAGKAGLNLMTCGGKYITDKETFTDRVIIYTEQI